MAKIGCDHLSQYCVSLTQACITGFPLWLSRGNNLGMFLTIPLLVVMVVVCKCAKSTHFQETTDPKNSISMKKYNKTQ